MSVNSRHMTTSFFSTCLVMINSDSVQDSFWSNHKDVSNNITYEHLRQLLLNNETKQLDPSLQAGFFTTWKKWSSHVPGIHRHYHSYLVSLLFAAPIPTLVIFVNFLPLVTIYVQWILFKFAYVAWRGVAGDYTRSLFANSAYVEAMVSCHNEGYCNSSSCCSNITWGSCASSSS